MQKSFFHLVCFRMWSIVKIRRLEMMVRGQFGASDYSQVEPTLDSADDPRGSTGRSTSDVTSSGMNLLCSAAGESSHSAGDLTFLFPE